MQTETYQMALKATQDHHARKKTFGGRFLFRYAERVKQVIDEHQCRTMLDYGCGKGVQYQKTMASGLMLKDYFGLEQIAMYDPGLPQFSTLPDGQFDIVVATQVLCWIPVADIPWVVDLLYERANKAVFVGEQVRYPKKQMMKAIEDQMPFRWTVDDWKAALARPDVDKAMYLQAGNEMIRVQ